MKELKKINFVCRPKINEMLETLMEDEGYTNKQVFLTKLVMRYYNRGCGKVNASIHPASALVGIDAPFTNKLVSNYIKIDLEKYEKICKLAEYHYCVDLDENGEVYKHNFSKLFWLLISDSYRKYQKRTADITAKKKVTVKKPKDLFDIADALDEF